jgi:hypothetical protein
MHRHILYCCGLFASGLSALVGLHRRLASNAAIDHEFVRFIRSGIPLFVNVTNKLVQWQMAMLLQLLMNAFPVRLRPAAARSK